MPHPKREKHVQKYSSRIGEIITYRDRIIKGPIKFWGKHVWGIANTDLHLRLEQKG